MKDPTPQIANFRWPSEGAASPGIPRPRGLKAPGVKARMCALAGGTSTKQETYERCATEGGGANPLVKGEFLGEE